MITENEILGKTGMTEEEYQDLGEIYREVLNRIMTADHQKPEKRCVLKKITRFQDMPDE